MYRFFYHYNRGKKAMSVHFRGKCYAASNVECNVPCETKWNDKQPYLVMRGWAEDVSIKDGKALIQ